MADSIDHLLREGADLLTGGQPGRACERAREALRLRPNHPLATNLLGLALLEQGEHAEARDLFESLVRRNPDVAPLQINAGLVALGQGELEQALEHFRRAIDLDPGHGRTFGYLALVHLRLGEAGFARAALQEAGLEALAAQIGGDDEEAVLRELELAVKALPGQALAPDEGFAEVWAIPGAAVEPEPGDIAESEESQSGGAGGRRRQIVDEIGEALDHALAEGDPELIALARQEPEVTRKVEIPASKLPEADARSLAAPQGEVEQQGPLLLLPLHTARSQDGVLARQDLALLQQGLLSWDEAQRRRKGKKDGAFLVGDGQLMKVEGEGLLVLHPGPGRRFHLFRLDQAGLYVMEHGLAAFADRLYWENGRIPRAGEESPPIVTLRGTGFVAVVGHGQLWRVATSQSEQLTVRIDHLLGWSPNAVPEVVQRRGDLLHVGFKGAGVVWLDLPE